MEDPHSQCITFHLIRILVNVFIETYKIEGIFQGKIHDIFGNTAPRDCTSLTGARAERDIRSIHKVVRVVF